MPYSVTYDSETDCILISVEGDLNLSMIDGLAVEVALCLEEYDCRCVLNDLRNARLTESVFDIYSIPKLAMNLGITRSVKRALVVNGPFSEFRFLETVFVNQGNIVKMFNSIDEARQWLFSGKADF